MEMHDRDRLDQLLDSALQQYGNAQPRTGLEGRILVRLSTQDRSAVRRRWVLSFAGIAIVCAISLALWQSGNSRKSHRDIAEPAVVEHATPPGVVDKGAASFADQQGGPVRENGRAHVKHSAELGTEAMNASPRMQQFPSPRPVTPKELTLAEYAARFPQEAELVAKEQETFQQEIEEAKRKLQDENQSRTEER